MKSISAICLVLAIWLALLFGAQTAAWSWGPALLALGFAVLFGMFERPHGGRAPVLWASLLMGGGWFIYRCFTSPVVDFARADGMLVVALLAAAWLASGLDLAGRELRILFVGLAVSVIANVVMGAIQLGSPDFMWPYAYRPSPKPTGFFGHYNYFSNYVLGAGFLLLGRALFSRDIKWQRLVYGGAFLGAAAIVPLSGSRGGVLALGTGVTLMMVVAGILAWRKRSRLLPLIALGIPLLLIVSGFAGWRVLGEIQTSRKLGNNVVGVFENDARLQWIDLALKVAGDHPVSGGGSRAYSWMRNQKWVFSESGYGRENEPFVHNELVQVAADYGWLGVGLVLVSLLLLVGIGMIGLFVGSPNRDEERICDPVHAGVVAAAGALLIQANFSFVYHMLPSVLLLGLCFGLAAATRGRKAETLGMVPMIRRTVVGVLIALPLLWLGFGATRALDRLWPVLYTTRSLALSRPDAALQRLDEAYQVWPGFELLEEKGKLAGGLAGVPELSNPVVRERLEIAAEAYRQGLLWHPYHPGLAVNLANALSALGYEDEASDNYARAIDLQGGLEAAFQARYYEAEHIYRLWYQRWREERRAAEALGQFQKALALLDVAEPMIPETQRLEAKPLRENLEQAITFLEGAKIVPQPVTD